MLFKWRKSPAQRFEASIHKVSFHTHNLKFYYRYPCTIALNVLYICICWTSNLISREGWTWSCNMVVFIFQTLILASVDKFIQKIQICSECISVLLTSTYITRSSRRVKYSVSPVQPGHLGYRAAWVGWQRSFYWCSAADLLNPKNPRNEKCSPERDSMRLLCCAQNQCIIMHRKHVQP